MLGTREDHNSKLLLLDENYKTIVQSSHTSGFTYNLFKLNLVFFYLLKTFHNIFVHTKNLLNKIIHIKVPIFKIELGTND